MIPDLYDKIISQRGKMGNLGARIPGYRGYQDAQVRREADRLLREHVATQFQQQLNRLPEIERALLDKGGLQWMDDTRSVKTQMLIFIERIRTASRGFSGLFSNIKIDAEELDKLYAFDEAMLRYVEDFTAKFDALAQAAASNEGIGEAVAALRTLISEADQAYSLRDDIATGLAGEQETSL